MALTSQQKTDISRLRGNEMLTGNLTDTAATAVLDWGEAQIAAGVPYATVIASIRAANATETEDAALALAAANQTLATVLPGPAKAAVARPPAKSTATARPKSPRRRPPGPAAPVPPSVADTTFEERHPLPPSAEGPDEAQHDASASDADPPGRVPFEDKLPLPTAHEGPDDNHDDDGVPMPPASPVSRK